MTAGRLVAVWGTPRSPKAAPSTCPCSMPAACSRLAIAMRPWETGRPQLPRWNVPLTPWQAIIFNNDSGLLVFKEPINCAAYCLLTTQVFLSPEGTDLTPPVNLVHNKIINLSDLLSIIKLIFPWPIHCEIESWRSSPTNGAKDLF